MRSSFVWMFVFIILFVLVSGQGEWSEINVGDGVVRDGQQESVALENQTIKEGQQEVGVSDVQMTDNERGVRENGEFYTSNFYFALGLVLVIIIVLGIFVWLWIRGPKNKWEK